MTEEIHIIKLTDEEAHDLYMHGVSLEEIKKKKRYIISKKDYEEMIKKRNSTGDTSTCKCGHSIYDHEPTTNFYEYPAGKCVYYRLKDCYCLEYEDSTQMQL